MAGLGIIDVVVLEDRVELYSIASEVILEVPLGGKQLVQASLVEAAGYGWRDQLIGLRSSASDEVVGGGDEPILSIYALAADYDEKEIID